MKLNAKQTLVAICKKTHKTETAPNGAVSVLCLAGNVP